jgi:mannan endo-1,4-beta-mannosidase
MKRIFSSIVLVLLMISVLSAQKAAKSPFVRVRGSQLMLNNKLYYFCGTNFWYGCYIGSKGKTGDRERLKRELDELVSLGINNLRILAASEAANSPGTLNPAIQTAKGVYNEELLDGLDFLLAEMGKRKMVGVLYLNNYWQWSGGMVQYLNWIKSSDKENQSSGTGEGFRISSTSFYSNKPANDLYRNYIAMLINRKNSYTGLQYKNDPAIMAWQLANEPRGGEGRDGRKNIEDYYRWIDETAAFIHSLDKNHLVSSGSEGTIGTSNSAEIYEKAHQSKNIDYLTFHLWAKNWGWFNSKKFAETEKTSEIKAAEYIDNHIQFAQKLGKPIVMEEFGLDRDSSKCMPGTPVTARDKYYKYIFNIVAGNAKNNSPLMGTNFWGWAGEAVPVSPDGKVLPASPFLADPWQEPQGLNSVFQSDATTVEIIREHAGKMNGLGK